MNKKQFLTSMVLGVSALSVASTAQAHKEKKDNQMEKCYGVVKAGKNDCEAANGKHSCAGGSKVDGDINAWILMPSGLCDKIVGGKVGK